METDIVPLLQALDNDIDGLHDALHPLLTTSLEDNADKLPLKEQAQLHILWTYAIESLLFCMTSLRRLR